MFWLQRALAPERNECFKYSINKETESFVAYIMNKKIILIIVYIITSQSLCEQLSSFLKAEGSCWYGGGKWYVKM